MKKVFTKSEAYNREYACTIVKIGELHPIEGKDKIVSTLVNGLSMVIRKDQVKEGDIMIYAMNETQLNEKFLSANNLYDIENYDKNSNAVEVGKLLFEDKKDEAKTHVGFFNKYGRVKLIRLGGTPSYGYLFSINELAKVYPDVLDVNLEELVDTDFDTVCGELFVQVYVPPVKEGTPRGSRDKKRNRKLFQFDRLIPGHFSFHYDTGQFAREVKNFQPTDVVSISVKIHGCVEENTIVETLEYGKITIGEIVNKQIDCHIRARDINSETDVFVPIDNFYKVENDGEWYEIELENGTKLIITGNNPVWCPELGVYRRVDELVGDEKLLIS